MGDPDLGEDPAFINRWTRRIFDQVIRAGDRLVYEPTADAVRHFVVPTMRERGVSGGR